MFKLDGTGIASGVAAGASAGFGSVSQGNKPVPKVDRIDAIINEIQSLAEFEKYYLDLENRCFRIAVNNLYNEYSRENDVKKDDGFFTRLGKNIRKSVLPPIPQKYIGQYYPGKATFYVYTYKLEKAKEALRNCLSKKGAQEISNVSSDKPKRSDLKEIDDVAPFDARLERIQLSPNSDNGISILSFATKFKSVSISGYVPSAEGLQAMIDNFKDKDKPEEFVAKILDTESQESKYGQNVAKMLKNPYYHGVPSIINTYSMTRLYGSEGGQYLVDRIRERKWYEIDKATTTDPSSGILNYSKNPTTTSIINWGEGDPYGRTPYHYSDFVFCKHWGVVPNNRLITLRRFPAPIIDNMNFPGMDGIPSEQPPGDSAPKNQKLDSKDNKGKKTNSKDTEDTKNADNTPNSTTTNPDDQGSSKPASFPPMATVLTYFGEETDNKLSSILKFTTGFEWDEVEADVWNVGTQQNPNMDAGPGGLSSGLTNIAKTLNIITGSFNQSAILNKENLPPDPYSDGPYENRVIGPVNAITKVKKRKRGIEYTHDIALTFNYVARPIGGINSKAALLDILSNFLVIGSASAMFWGGQHRFMGQPQGYPFMGGAKGMAAWYRGDPIGWGKETITTFAGQAETGLGDLVGLFKNFFSSIFSGASFLSAVTNTAQGKTPEGKDGGNKALANAIRAYSAERSAGTIPYLTGFKALLTGEPVGEWHLTIGNPLNPIAMIGNLICKNIEVEFGDELGPDDFPLEMKVIVNLEHGMARDRDAIQSMFNRGMGRIYDLPNAFIGSADVETKVDVNTGIAKGIIDPKTGRTPKDWWSGVAIGAGGGGTGKALVVPPQNNSNPSVWNPIQFKAGSSDQIGTFKNDITLRSQFRVSDWIAKKAVK